MRASSSLPRYAADEDGRLITVVEEIEQARERGDYEHIQRLVDEEMTAVWFSHDQDSFVALIEELHDHLPRLTPMVAEFYDIFSGSTTSSKTAEVAWLPTTSASQKAFQKLFLQMFRARVDGRMVAAHEYAEDLHKSLQRPTQFITRRSDWELHIPIQLGNCALLAGDFSRALVAFTQAQFHSPLRSFEFLTRDALIKTALLHGFFGNDQTARADLEQAEKIPRTTSWVEPHLDVLEEFVHIMIDPASQGENLQKIIDLASQDVGEMWPFHIFLLTRRLQASGRREELEQQLKAFDSMPLVKHERDGFSGSVIPVSRAILALQNGKLAQAQKYLDRADPRIPFTRVFQAAASIYSGRPRKAVEQAWQLYDETRGFRILEIRRLAILASAHLQLEDPDGSVDVLRQAAQLPGGLSEYEVIFFSPETRTLAQKHVRNWPSTDLPSVFLTSIPEPSKMLTDRELQIVSELAEGHTRATIARSLDITVNTIKTQLRSIYHKLGVTSREDAVQAASDSGLI